VDAAYVARRLALANGMEVRIDCVRKWIFETVIEAVQGMKLM